MENYGLILKVFLRLLDIFNATKRRFVPLFLVSFTENFSQGKEWTTLRGLKNTTVHFHMTKRGVSEMQRLKENSLEYIMIAKRF